MAGLYVFYGQLSDENTKLHVRRPQQEEHELEFRFNLDGHPTEIVCSCGKEFKVTEQ